MLLLTKNFDKKKKKKKKKNSFVIYVFFSVGHLTISIFRGMFSVKYMYI